MGKKSRRPNRNNPKVIPAVASPPFAAQEEEASTTGVAALDQDQLNDLVATFKQLCVSRD